MEQQEQQVTNAGASAMNDAALWQLRGSASWIIFISAVGFIFTLLLVISAVGLMTNPTLRAAGVGGMGAAAGIIYIIMAVIIFLINFFLIKYGLGIKKAVRLKDNASLEDAFRKQKTYWVFKGVLTIIYLFFMLIAFIGFLTGSMVGQSGMF